MQAALELLDYAIQEADQRFAALGYLQTASHHDKVTHYFIFQEESTAYLRLKFMREDLEKVVSAKKEHFAKQVSELRSSKAELHGRKARELVPEERKEAKRKPDHLDQARHELDMALYLDWSGLSNTDRGQDNRALYNVYHKLSQTFTSTTNTNDHPAEADLADTGQWHHDSTEAPSRECEVCVVS